jgi:hypothetical protein
MLLGQPKIPGGLKVVLLRLYLLENNKFDQNLLIGFLSQVSGGNREKRPFIHLIWAGAGPLFARTSFRCFRGELHCKGERVLLLEPKTSGSQDRTKLEKDLSDFHDRLSRAPGNGFGGHCLQHFLVHISQLFDVDAAFASGVLAEFWQQRFRVA